MGVAGLAETETAVFLRDLDAECAQLPEALQNCLWNLAVAIDLVAVDLLPHEALEPLEERSRLRCLGRILSREGVDQVEPESPFEQLAHEARRLPFLLPRCFGDFASLLLGCERRFGRTDVRRSEDVGHGDGSDSGLG